MSNLRRFATTAGQAAGAELDAKAKHLQRTDARRLSYTEAFAIVLADPANAELKQSFGSVR
jgi:hypothetical protein